MSEPTFFSRSFDAGTKRRANLGSGEPREAKPGSGIHSSASGGKSSPLSNITIKQGHPTEPTSETGGPDTKERNACPSSN